MFHKILSQIFLCLLKWGIFSEKRRSECWRSNVANKPMWWLFSLMVVFTHFIRIIILAFHLHLLITAQMTHSGDKHQLPEITQPQSFGSYVFCAEASFTFFHFFIMAMFLLIFGLGEENTVYWICLYSHFFSGTNKCSIKKTLCPCHITNPCGWHSSVSV